MKEPGRRASDLDLALAVLSVPLSPPRFLFLSLLISFLPIFTFSFCVRLRFAVGGRLETDYSAEALLPCGKCSHMGVRLTKVPHAIVNGKSNACVDDISLNITTKRRQVVGTRPRTSDKREEHSL